MDSATPTLNRPAPAALDLLLTRRSGSAKAMKEPGPSMPQLQQILAAASRTPDHGKLFPWRFIVFEGDARTRFGDVLVDCLLALEPQTPPERLEMERGRF